MYHSPPAALCEELLQAVDPVAVVAGDGRMAELCLERRIPFFGLGFTSEHCAALVSRLEGRIFKKMLSDQSKLFAPALKVILDKNNNQQEEETEPQPQKTTSRKRKTKKIDTGAVYGNGEGESGEPAGSDLQIVDGDNGQDGQVEKKSRKAKSKGKPETTAADMLGQVPPSFLLPPPASRLTHNLPTHNLPTSNLLTHNLPTHNLPTHNFPTYNLLTHNLLTHNLLTHNLPTHNLLTHNFPTYNLLTHNLPTHNLLTHNLLTHTTYPHTTYTHLTHTQLTHTQLTHTQLTHTQLTHTHTQLTHTQLTNTQLTHNTHTHTRQELILRWISWELNPRHAKPNKT